MKYERGLEDVDIRLSDFLRPKERLELLDVFLSRGPWPVTESDLAHLTTLAETDISGELKPLRDIGLVKYEDGEYWLDGDSVAGSALQGARDSILNHDKTIDSSTEDRYPEEDAWVVGSPFVELFRQDKEMSILGALLDSDSGTIPRVLTPKHDMDRNRIDPRATLLVDIGVAEVADETTIATAHLSDGDNVDRGYRLSSNTTVDALQTAVNTVGEPRENGFYCRVDDTSIVTTATVDSESETAPGSLYDTEESTASTSGLSPSIDEYSS